MRAIITVIGKDMVGILANVSQACAQYEINILEVSQSILHEFFVMTMLVDISGSPLNISEISDKMDALGDQMNLKIKVMHEDIFNSMHRI